MNQDELKKAAALAALDYVEDGMIVGRSPGIAYNDFLATEKSYGDFILQFGGSVENRHQSCPVVSGSDGCPRQGFLPS